MSLHDKHEERQLGPPKWDGDPATCEVWFERVRYYVMGTKKEERTLLGAQLIRSMDPNSRQYQVAIQVKDSEVMAEDGAMRVAKFVQDMLAETTLQEAAASFRELMKGSELRRISGEGVRSWSERFTQLVTKCGRKLHAACEEIPVADFLHTFLIGLMYLEASGFDTTERAAILSTSGKRSEGRRDCHHRDRELVQVCGLAKLDDRAVVGRGDRGT